MTKIKDLEKIECCTICSSMNTTVIIDDCRDYLCGHAGVFEISKCTSCGHAFLSVRPYVENISRYYETGYYTHNQINPQAINSRIKLYFFKKYIEKIKNFIAGRHLENSYPKINGKFFDYGCGSGKLMRKLSDNGWRVSGYEPDIRACNLANFYLPDSSIYNDQSCIDNNNNYNNFELVIMSHVLEHLYDPSFIIEKLFRFVLPGGKLVVRVPDTNSIESKIFGKYWRGLEVPRHIQHFSEDSILKLLESIKFKNIVIKREALPMSLVESINFFITNKLKIKLPFDRKFYRFLYVVNYFPSQLLRMIGISSSLEIHIYK
jgi:SAM-dependent methyltransferase